MIKTVLYFLLLLSLISCSISSKYEPKLLSNDGYKDLKMSPTLYKVSFIGNYDTDSEQVNNFALLRASELTLLHGYQYFKVISTNNEVIKDNRKISRQRAVITIHTYYKENGKDMCRIEKDGVVDYINMNKDLNQAQMSDMMINHNSSDSNTYSEVVYEDYVDEFILEKQKTVILIKFINDIEMNDREIKNANEVFEKITIQYKIKLNT